MYRLICYSAGIMAFAYGMPCVYLETNVRAVFIHYFFSDAHDPVPDARLVPLVRATCDRADPRGWYYALLDCGAYLKKTQPNPTRRSASYARQSAFEGSVRQKRAFIVREVLASPGMSREALLQLLNDAERAAGRDAVDEDAFDALLDALSGEGFFAVEDGALIP